MLGTRLSILATLIAFGLLSNPTYGAGSLGITDASGPPGSADVTPGGEFVFTVTFNTTIPTAGVDYGFGVNAAGHGLFSIKSRSLAGSPFSLANAVSESDLLSPAVGSILDADNTLNLGAAAPGVTLVPAGSHLLGNYTLSVAPGTPLGAYTISTANGPPGIGYFDDANEYPYDSQGSYIVNVVPEPAGLGGLLLAAVVLHRRRRTSRLR